MIHEPTDGGSYTGDSVCKQCHPDQTDQWLTTAHAEAFESLKERSQDYNPECIPCHTTGFGYTGGFIRPDLTSEMEGVQCEMCHGAGAEHAENPTSPIGTVSGRPVLIHVIHQNRVLNLIILSTIRE